MPVNTLANPIKEAIRQFVLSQSLPGELPENLRDDTPLQSSGILDSLATVTLVAYLEKEFGIDVDVYDTTVEHFDSIHDIAELVARKRAARV